MASNYQITPLGSIVKNFDSRRIPLSNRERRKCQGPYPYYGATGVMDHVNDYLFEGLYLLVAEDGSVERPDGRPFLQLVDGKFWVNNHSHVLRGVTDEDTKYLYYALSTVAVRPYISGSVQDKLSQNNLNRILTPYPVNKADRCAIANILGTLDDKIELNRRMNETLEAMTRALFKSWFVDFDPVRAKMSGRWKRGQSLPGLPANLWDLFPGRFVNSELGEIPEGWAVGTLGEVAEYPRRGVHPEQIASDVPYIALEHMPKRSIALSEWDAADGLESNKLQFKKGEILFGKLRPYFHKVGVAPIDGVCSTDIVVIAPRSRQWFGFVLGHASSVAFVEYTSAGSSGTKMPRTSWQDMARYPIVLPTKPLATAHTHFIQASVDRIIAGIHEFRTLAALRDAILPKLICGELRVKNAEQFLESATFSLSEVEK